MKKLKFTFKNAAGEELAGLLNFRKSKAFALLAHCFTCGKDLKSCNMREAEVMLPTY
jgi:putative redox protein